MIISVDKSKNKTDVPHDYVVLPKAIQARYIKMVNIHMKLPKVVETMLNDKNVLYIVAFLAIMTFFGYIILRDSYALLIFLSIGFISTYFSKNI